MTEMYRQYLEKELIESYKELFKGEFHIPGIEVFKVSIEDEKTIFIHAIEDPSLGRNIWFEDKYIDALLELEELGAIEVLDRCDMVTMYEVHDSNSHKTLLALWSYRLRE